MTFDLPITPQGKRWKVKAVSALRFSPSGAGGQDFNNFPLGGIYLVNQSANAVQDTGATTTINPDMGNRGLYLGPRNGLGGTLDSYGETTTAYAATPIAEECGASGLDLLIDQSLKIRFIYTPVGVVAAGAVQIVILAASVIEFC